MSYKSQSKFLISADYRMIYSLQPTGRWEKVNGVRQEIMQNDVYLQIEARHLPFEEQKELAETIAATLNERYVTLESKEVT
jgi:hypothetical protein